MKVLVLGMGLMGPTIAKDCAEAPDVSKVTGCDVDAEKLRDAFTYVGNTKFDTAELSVTDHQRLVEKMKDYDVVINGTAAKFSMNVLKAAMEAGTSLVDLAGGGYPHEGSIYEEVVESGITVIPGCGVDPGLIDMLSGHAFTFMDEVDEVTFACRFVHDMGREDHGQPAVFRRANELHNAARGHDVEPQSRLIENQHFRVVDQRARDRDLLLHPRGAYHGP